MCLNARGIRHFCKHETIFTWSNKQKGDIAFLQETYTSREIENEWKFQWRDKMLFAHGTNLSRGVFILFSSELQVNITNMQEDTEGRFIFVEAVIQD